MLYFCLSFECLTQVRLGIIRKLIGDFWTYTGVILSANHAIRLTQSTVSEHCRIRINAEARDFVGFAWHMLFTTHRHCRELIGCVGIRWYGCCVLCRHQLVRMLCVNPPFTAKDSSSSLNSVQLVDQIWKLMKLVC